MVAFTSINTPVLTHNTVIGGPPAVIFTDADEGELDSEDSRYLDIFLEVQCLQVLQEHEIHEAV